MSVKTVAHWSGFTVPVALAGALLATLAASTLSASADPMNNYNLIVLGNMTASSDVEGTAFIGGNLNGTSNWGTSLSAPSYTGQNVLTVLGNIGNAQNSDIQLGAGNLLLGGTVEAGSTVNYNGGGKLVTSPLPSLTTITNTLNSDQTYLASLTPNSTYTTPASPANVTLNATPNSAGLAVFSIAASSLFGNGNIQSLNINTNSASEVVINVTSGASVDISSPNFVGNFTGTAADSSVIWNFVNATSISLGVELHGSLLAPNASLTTSSPIDGSVAVGSFHAGSEIHLPLLIPNPHPSTPTPEPGAVALLVMGAAGMLLIGRKRA